MMINLKIKPVKITQRIVIELFLSLLFMLFMLFLVRDIVIRNTIRTNQKQIRVEMVLKTLNDDTFEIFYDIGNRWNINDAVSQKVHGRSTFQPIVFIIPTDTIIKGLRFDIGTVPGLVQIKSIKLKCFGEEYEWKDQNIGKKFTPLTYYSSFYISHNLFHVKTKEVVQHFYTKDDISSITTNMLFNIKRKIISLIIAIILAIIFFLGVHYIPFSSFKFMPANYSNYLSAYTLKDFFFVIIFMLLIFLPLLSKIIRIDPMAKNKEKRLLATKPDFRFNAALTYPHYYSVYFNDHFGFRNLLVFSNSYTKLKFFKTSPMPNKVLLGKEDWFYYSEGEVLDDCRHNNLFTENQLKKIKEILEDRAKWLESKGSRYYIFVPPSKNSVYPEFTPPYIKPKIQKSRLDQLIEYLEKNSFVSIIDPRNLYFREKKKHVLYYKNDSHWNFYGAFFGYTELMNTISKSVPSIKPSTISDYTIKYNDVYEGDLAQILAVDQVFKCDDFQFIPKKTRQAKNIKPPKYPKGEIFKAETVVTVVPDSSLPVLVMFRDSYGSYMVPFISEHFRRSVYVWTPMFKRDIIEYEKPQIVVQEILERFLGFLELENLEVDAIEHNIQ